MLAVRIAVKRHNHDHRRLNISRIDTSSKRLLLRLEAARKRAKRAEIRQMGLLEYRRLPRLAELLSLASLPFP